MDTAYSLPLVGSRRPAQGKRVLREHHAVPSAAPLPMPMTLPQLSQAVRTELVAYLIKRCQQQALAEDVAHDAMERLLVFAQREVVENPRALLFRIADNLLINAHKAQARRAADQLDEDVEDHQPTAERRLLDQERLQQVQAIIANMPSKRREVFIRRRLEGQSIREIAQDLRMSTASVEKHIVRALKVLRDELESEHKYAGGQP